MNIMGSRIKELRLQKGMTQDELAEKLGVNRANISNYERGQITNIPSDKLDIMADLFDTNVDYIMGRSDVRDKENGKKYYELTEKDERDIAKKLEAMMNDLDSDSSLSFMGEPMDEEDRELLRISIENTLRMSREMAKKKFTPNKYRK
ncbi:helix-turn-helix transcriptional regulator [Paenibacillus lactis]|jgi:transcriptional regulator with XRE-family HTH domain|uniref:helix-turn-helix domain-containing protein n=1 Tax=Paenibacillus TaxID=44249 RepID=UPI00203ACB61|nr:MULTISPECIES: helix-turn-helix transcriptional regulator [Paenibacillus]MCI1777151.1 helix-turn-helix transcriptional regulator [Paenibacillus lautus]MCM3494525.1 helix-turn-helix transcriptional regulator [Paenibacillus lactis]